MVPFGRIVGERVIVGHTGGGAGAAATRTVNGTAWKNTSVRVGGSYRDWRRACSCWRSGQNCRRQREPGRQHADRHAKAYGAVPPLAVSVWVYAIPTTPLGSVAGNSAIVGHTGGTGGRPRLMTVNTTA